MLSWDESDADFEKRLARERKAARREILKLYGLKEWQIGLKPIPRRVLVWAAIRRITSYAFGRE